jgi:glycosyltransferase involved in cell wall biosynthesis
MTRVLHVITALDVGGAELALLRLLAGTDRARISPGVVSLVPGGTVRSRIATLGVPVSDLGMTSVKDVPRGVARLVALLRQDRVDVVQTWMHHADLLGGAAGRLAGVPVVWGLRMGRLDAETASTRLVARLNAGLARVVPAAVVACSATAANEHVARGYPRDRVVVIPNGYALPTESAASRAAFRSSIGIPADARVIGRVGRWHTMKDYPTFMRAAGGLLAGSHGVHVVLVGGGVDHQNRELAALCADLADPSRVHLLGRRDDMPAVYSGLDVLCSSSSSGEGFPNVIAEALLHGVPVVATDVGESRNIVGDDRWIVAPKEPLALERALLALLALPADDRERVAAAGRDRVLREFGLAAMATAFQELHEQVTARGAHR